MYSETITLFNRYHSRLRDMWYPHILNNVNLIVDKASILAKYGAETSDKAKLNISYDNMNGTYYIDGIPYLPPKEWAKLTNDKLADHITFNSDSNYFDFFILGEYKSTDTIIDDDYVEGFYNYMQKENDFCYAITSVSSPYKVIPHFEIMAK